MAITPGTTFPIANGSSYNTNPSYSGTFIPTLWSKKLLVKLYQNLMLSEVTNVDYQGELRNHGDTVRIRSVPDVSIKPYEIGMNLSYEVPEPIYQDMQINQGMYFGVKVSDVLEYQSDIDLMNTFTDEAAKQLKIAIENEVFFSSFVNQGPSGANEGGTAGEISHAYNLGTDTAPIDQKDAQGILDAILRMSSVLDEQNVPEDDRYLIISPYDRHLLMQSDIAQANFTGDPRSTIRTGKIGSIDRFTVYVSNLLPRGAAGKSLVAGLSPTSDGSDLSGAQQRRLMVGGTKHAVSFASTIEKTEPIRDQNDFGDIVRGLAVYGRKVVKPECLTIAQVGDPAA